MCNDKINAPAHYTVYPVQTIELARDLSFCMGSVVKYVLRAPYKNGTEDCDKALKFLEFEKDSLRREIPVRVFNIWAESCEELCDYLRKADGDILWQDIAQATDSVLCIVRQYLYAGEAALLALIAVHIRRLREILELRDMKGQIYAGMTGLPRVSQ